MEKKEKTIDDIKNFGEKVVYNFGLIVGKATKTFIKGFNEGAEKKNKSKKDVA